MDDPGARSIIITLSFYARLLLLSHYMVLCIFPSVGRQKNPLSMLYIDVVLCTHYIVIHLNLFMFILFLGFLILFTQHLSCCDCDFTNFICFPIRLHSNLQNYSDSLESHTIKFCCLWDKFWLFVVFTCSVLFNELLLLLHLYQ